ncbi:MAG: type 1 glutamine amidotransferase domain-containing protein [Myxococcota bacterium]
MSNSKPSKKRVLIVAASPVEHPRLGFSMGFWAAELTHPYAELAAHGHEVTIASPNGGAIKPDDFSDPRHESGYSAHDFVSLGFLESARHAPLLDSTQPLDAVESTEFDAILVAGGMGPMFSFREHPKLQSLLREFYEAGKPTAALCHGVASLIDVTTSDGARLIAGKTITGFSLAEDKSSEEAIGAPIFDWYIEEAAKEAGAHYVENGMWANYAVEDGHLITGQQQNSGGSVAQLLVKQLSAR